MNIIIINIGCSGGDGSGGERHIVEINMVQVAA